MLLTADPTELRAPPLTDLPPERLPDDPATPAEPEDDLRAPPLTLETPPLRAAPELLRLTLEELRLELELLLLTLELPAERELEGTVPPTALEVLEELERPLT